MDRVIPPDWTPHRRDDGELVGWIRPAGDDWAAIDLLGRAASGPVDWLEAEAALEERGIGYLAQPWMLEGEADEPIRVRMVEVTPDRIVVKAEDFGDINAVVPRFELPWPLTERLREPRDGDPDGFTFFAP